MAVMSSMKSRGQTRKEAFDPTESLSSPRHQLRCGSWNVRTLAESSRVAQVINQMGKYRLNILGISEVRWPGSGLYDSPTGERMVYSGRKDNQMRDGVGLIMDKKAKKSLMEWEPVSHRILRARFYSRHAKMTIISCYSPTNEAEEEDKDEFYTMLQDTVSKVSSHDYLIILGDLNAKVGTDNAGYELHMGKQGIGVRNENGERFLDFCTENNMIIGGTLFKHKDIHKFTWTSPNGLIMNQIDHIAINRRWRTSLVDVRVVRGADVDSDHNLVLCKIRMKLKKFKKKESERQFNSKKLREPGSREAFSIELSNRFHVLTNLDPGNIDDYCNQVHEAFVGTSEETLGFNQNNRKAWISDVTWNLIKERGNVRMRMLACTDLIEKERLRELHRASRRDIKRAVRSDKRKYLEDKASDAENAAANGDSRTLYKITRELTGSVSAQPTVVQDVNGKLLTKEDEQRERWAEHFCTVLNRPDPETPAVVEDSNTTIEMKKGPITCKEIEEAIMETKGNRAPGDDRITSDMLKADPEMSAKCLVELFNRIWEEEEVPEAWQKGILIKLPKKGDLTSCGNWRGINLLSVPGKVFCRVILKRIKDGVEKLLREEQAGFRPSRSCVDQIFVLRTIMEQSKEWNSSLYINFIDFEKAFDSVHHTTLWNILRSYGFPDKIVNILTSFYSNNQCCVRHMGQQSEWFQVKSGVRQGCVISPLLFLVVIDWVMKRSTSDRPRGITWNSFDNLEDEDFADDIALLAHSNQDMQEKTSLIELYAGQVGLKISTSKTKVMRMNTRVRTDITVNGNPVENVEEFKYLGSK